MQCSYLIRGSLLSVIFIPFVIAQGEKYEKKRALEEEFIKIFGPAGSDSKILRNELRNLNPGARAYLCGQMLRTRYYTLVDFPLIETWYIAFRRNHTPIMAEILSCSTTLSLFEGIDDSGNYYLLKKKRIKKVMKVFPPSKKDPYHISERFSYKVNELKAAHHVLPSPIVRPTQYGNYYEPANSSGSNSSSRQPSREASFDSRRPSAPPLPSTPSRWPSFTAGMRYKRTSRGNTESFRPLR